MIKTLLWDVDGTLLSFTEAERGAIKTCFRLFGLGECTDEMVRRYSAVNARYWERLEMGEITKREVLNGRFREFFASEGILFDDLEAFNAEYQVRLGDTVCFNDNSYDIVRSFRGKIRQYAVTNGTRIAQKHKLTKSGLGELFDGIFVSDDIGFEKPSAGFFDYVLAHIEPCDRTEMLIVGDSLTSDIRGGNDAGIPTCWYNPKGLENTKGVHTDYVIRNLGEVEGIVLGVERHR